jgi:hypothetical protein
MTKKDRKAHPITGGLAQWRQYVRRQFCVKFNVTTVNSFFEVLLFLQSPEKINFYNRR